MYVTTFFAAFSKGQHTNEQLPASCLSVSEMNNINIGTMLFLAVTILLFLSPCLDAEDPFKPIASSTDGYEYREVNKGLYVVA